MRKSLARVSQTVRDIKAGEFGLPSEFWKHLRLPAKPH